MGRFLMYSMIALLAVFVVSTFTFLQHGSEGLGLVQTLTADQLASDPQPYNGATINVVGTLTFNSQLDRYELSPGTGKTTIPIRGLDDSALEPLAGLKVRVNGVFHLTGGNRRIDATAVRAEDEQPPSPTATPRAS